MQFTLPLYSRLFYIVGGSDVFLFVFCIGFFQSFVILILGIPRAIIMSGKLFPVKISKIAIPSVAFDKPNKQFQLLALTFRHHLHKLANGFTTAHLIVESHNLCQSPTCRRIGSFTMDSSCTLQTVIFLQATLIMGLRPFGIEDVFIAFLMFGRINASILQLTPENVSLK